MSGSSVASIETHFHYGFFPMEESNAKREEDPARDTTQDTTQDATQNSPSSMFDLPKEEDPRPIMPDPLDAFVPLALEVYQFIIAFGRQIHLSPFSMREFLDALCLSTPERASPIIEAVHRAFLRIITRERKALDGKTRFYNHTCYMDNTAYPLPPWTIQTDEELSSTGPSHPSPVSTASMPTEESDQQSETIPVDPSVPEEPVAKVDMISAPSSVRESTRKASSRGRGRSADSSLSLSTSTPIHGPWYLAQLDAYHWTQFLFPCLKEVSGRIFYPYLPLYLSLQ